MFMAGKEEIPTNNSTVLNILQIINAVMSYTSEAEFSTLFMNTKTAVSMRRTFEELGHPQTQTTIQKITQPHTLYSPIESFQRCSKPWICDSIGYNAAVHKTNIGTIRNLEPKI